MANQPWHRLPRDLRQALESHLAPGQTIRRPKRRHVSRRIVVRTFLQELDRDHARTHAETATARRLGLSPRTIRRLVRLVVEVDP